MEIKEPKNNDKYFWTKHVFEKMKQYQLSEQTVKRVIRSPERVEKGIAPGTTAAMQSRGKKKKTEIWIMYQEDKETRNQGIKESKRLKIITAWRYPGVSPIRDEIPIPQEIIDEISDLL